MSKKLRSLNRFTVALALVAVAVSARAGVQMFAAPPSSFDQLPDLRFNQGQTVTVAFAASGFPAGLTYTAEGLPPGLSLTMGVDRLGHEVGILNGTLPADTPQGGGSEGVYTMRIRASDGAVSNDFSVDVSHWSQGDVFVGGGEWRYQVYREDGSFKTDVTVPDDAQSTGGFTTGCAVNWNTGEVWATNFDEVDPALNVITRHAGNNPLPYTDPSRRLSTLRFRDPGDASPMDINPESVAFDNFGNMFVGHSFGFWNNNGDVADIDGVATILSNPNGPGWVYVDAAGQPRLAAGNELIFDTQPISPAGFFERWIQGNPPQNLLDGDGAPIRVRDQAGMDLHRYAPDANGNYNTADRTFFDVRYGYTGVDTLDLLSDQKTMAYSSENWYVYRYDVSAGAQLPVVGGAVVGESKPVTTRSLYGIRALPPGDGSGGYLVVNEYNIDRIDAQGNIIQQYDFRDDADYPPADNPNPAWAPRDVNGWFAIAIAAGGRSFWAATRQDVFHFDIASGEILGPKIRATEGVLHTNTELAGLCVMDEYRAAQEVCGPTGNGNGVDDDHDGTIDEGCFRIEICSALRPGDDDGDGLVNYNDPDCGATPQQQCNTTGATDNSVAGICDRADYEGDNVTVPGVPLPCSNDFDCSSWTFSYSADGLPPGLTMNPQTGDVSGMPLFSIVNPNSELSPPVVYPITVHATWQQQGQPATTFNNSFNWTIYNRNRVPVANDDGPQSVMAGDSFSFDVRLNDSDIDGDTFTILSFTQPAPGQGTVVQQGQNLVYTAPVSGFGGTTTFTYKVKDTYNPAGESNDATVTVIVNGPPVAVNDNYVALWNTTLNVPVSLGIIRNAPGRDSDPEGMPISVIPSSVTSPSHGTVTVNADGSFDYTPNTGFFGVDTYQYQVTDGTLSSNTATVTITVHRPPVGVDDFYVTPMNVPLVLGAPGIMANDSDPEGGAITVVLGSLGHVMNGTLAVQANGAIVYTPNLNWTGVETFNYRVKNAYYESENTTVTIKVNDVPLAVNDAFTTAEDTPVSASLTGNDTPSRDGGNVWTKTSNPANGTATVNPDGTFTYTPNANFNGTDSFTYKVCDVDNECANATVTITITAVDDLPVAVDDAFTTPEDTPVSGTLTGNDTPSGDGGNVWTKTSNPSNGTATVNADGTFAYTPNANFHGTDSFTYRVCDVDGDCATATVTITITSVDDAPVAVNDSFTTPEDTPVSGTLTGNDTPSGDGGNVWSKTSNPSNGTATVNPDGTFTYTPNANFNGTDSFTYQVCDADGDCSTATVTITITPVDDAPLAVNDAFTTAEDTPVSGTLTGNDTPSGDGGNVWTKTSNPANGTAVVNADGTFTYTPNANFHGTDSFTYQVCDADGDCSTATVTITITSVNEVPLAVDDAFTTAEDTPVSGTVTGNDTPSPDGGNVWTKTSNPTNGTATLNANGTFTYTPNANFHGTDSFTYRLCDVDGDCATATVTITITSVNDVPVAVNDSFTTPEDTPVSGTLKTNDTLSGDGGNVWTKASDPSNGTATVNPDGTFTYTPNANFNGTDSFTYTLCDADGDCATATVTITITSVDDAPIAVNDAFTTDEDTPVSGTLTGNDTPSGDGGNVWSKVTNPANGTAVVNADGTFTYTPNANFFGTDVFTYRVCDADGDCSTATVTITIRSVNDVPLAMDDAFTTTEDTPVSGTVVTNDTLSGDGGNVWTLLTSTSNGTLTFTNGAFTYTPRKDFSGIDSFTYKICDVNGDCSSATVIITINPVNDVPVAVNDVYTMAPNTSITKDASGNDTASGDGGNVWTKTSNPSSGTVVFNADGTFTYTAATGFSGVVSFNYKLCDVNNDCSNATVTITIAAVSTGAVGKGDTATIGYWQNQNGQALIKKMNGSTSATNLGNWLAGNFPYLWGANASNANNLTGKTNTQVAAYYITVFKSDKWMAQVLAGAIASYVTNSTLAGANYSVPYGFNYSVTGTGSKTYNVGSYGTAIGLANNTSYTISALLQQANLRKQQGNYNANAFNVIFSGINQAGDIK